MKDTEVLSETTQIMPESSRSGKFQRMLDGRSVLFEVSGSETIVFMRASRFKTPRMVEKRRDEYLKDAGSVPEARDVLHELIVRRPNSELSALKRAPKFSDYVQTYLADYVKLMALAVLGKMKRVA